MIIKNRQNCDKEREDINVKKKLIAMLLTASMAISVLAGCGNKPSEEGEDGQQAAESGQEEVQETEQGTGEGEESEGEEASGDAVLKDGEMTELLMVWPGSNASPASMQEVEDAMNEIIAPVVDAKVKLQIIEWGSYDDQTNLMLSSGEKLDIFFTTSNIREKGQRGQLYDISKDIQTYAPDAYKALERYIDACYFDGALYGLPSFRDMAAQAGLMCRKDILDETDYTADDIKTLEDVEKVLAKVKELHPDMYPLIPSDLTSGCLMRGIQGQFDNIAAGVGVDMGDDPSDGVTIVSLYETEQYKALAQRAYDWNQKGYFMPDSTTNTTPRQDILKAGNAFGYLGNYHPGIVTQETMNTGMEIVAVPVTAKSLSTESVNFVEWLIAAQCENPQKALAVLNLLYSNADFQNLFRYGIEGKDYEVKDEQNGVAGYPEGITSANVGWGNEMWISGNAAVGYAWETDPEEVFIRYAEFNDTAVLSPLYGFIYDTGNVRNEITAISNATDKYKAIIENGDADPDTSLEAFNEELKAAGIENIIADMQAQADAWLNENK